MAKFILLVVGGAIGTVSRYLLAGIVYRGFGTQFPYGTMAVNLSGCFIIGFLAALVEKKFLLGPNMRVFLMIGFCGAFTTFSTLIFETDNLIKDGEIARAVVNVLLSCIVGIVLFRVGSLLAEKL
jgi:CrcB protein